MIATVSRGQEVPNLNGFRYVIVETLFYKNNEADIYGVSKSIREKFREMGFKIAGPNKESWDDDLRENPCLQLKCNLDVQVRIMGRQKVDMQLYDCRSELIFQAEGFGNAETYEGSYAICVRNIFENFEEVKYQFDPESTPEAILRKVEKVDQDEVSAMAYFDETDTDPLEGIYESLQGNSVYNKFVIRKSEDEFRAIILKSDNENWNQGEVRGYFTKSTIPNVYNVRWSDEKKVEDETIAYIEGDGDLSVEMERKDGSKFKVDFKKIYPE